MRLTSMFVYLCFAFHIGCQSMRKPPEPTLNQRMLEERKRQEQLGADMQPSSHLVSADPMSASLWNQSLGNPSMIRNQKAQKAGDLLTILIKEKTSAATNAKTDAKKENKIDLGGSLSFGQSAATQVGTLTGSSNNKSEFKGDGQTNRSAEFETNVQAVVGNVLPNGTLFVRGRKAMTINNENQEIEISGFVRPDDIQINNTVISTLMADAEIRYFGDGVISDKQQSGWGTRLMDAVWPF